MESESTGSEGAQQAQSRESSTISFPYLDLGDGISVAKAVFDKAGGTCSLDQLAAYLGHATISSGGYRLKLAAARIFKLIEINKDTVQLSNLGFEIVTSGREKAAAAESFLQVPLYKATFDRFRGRQLPPDGALERVFIEMGVAKKQAAKARQVFQRSADQAGFFESGRDRLIEPSNKPGAVSTSPQMERPAPSLPAGGLSDMPEMPELITAMFKQLPPSGVGFPKDRRAKWIQTLGNVLELVYGSEDY